MILLNDLHLDANRSAGATPASAKALKDYSLNSFISFLQTIDEDLIIVGDLMDTWQIGLSTVLAVYKAFDEWLVRGHRLIVQAANHDLSTDSSKYGSLQFLMALFDNHPRVQFVIGEGAWVGDSMYCIPQVKSQDLFDLELSKVPECDVLFLHCNIDNFHAVSSDHSLNITKEQIDKLPVKLIYSGHEHHARKFGKVFIGGVQWSTSIADCLDKKDKFAYRLTGLALESIKTEDTKTTYAELDWRELSDCEAPFIRIVGSCLPAEAADMANAIAGYRKRFKAFVVGNAVKVQNMESAQELATLEDIEKFNILDILKEYLTETEYEKIESLNV